MNATDPNLFIVGGPKAGTTALALYLSQHEKVFFSAPKEPFYWCKDFPASKDSFGMHSLDAYRELFRNADPNQFPIRGEGSTTYLQSHVAIQEIIKFNPNAKFIAMLRNPVEVVHAMHGELVRHHIEDETDFEKAWSLQDARARGEQMPRHPRMPHQLQFRDVASYAPQLRRFFEAVPASQRRVIIFDDFKQDTAACYRKTLEFLGLPDDGRSDFPRVHAAKVYRSEIVGRLYNHPPAVLRWPIEKVKKWYVGGHGPIRSALSSVLSSTKERQSLRPEFENHLREVFRDDVKATSEMIGRDLSHWVSDADGKTATETPDKEMTRPIEVT